MKQNRGTLAMNQLEFAATHFLKIVSFRKVYVDLSDEALSILVAQGASKLSDIKM